MEWTVRGTRKRTSPALHKEHLSVILPEKGKGRQQRNELADDRVRGPLGTPETITMLREEDSHHPQATTAAGTPEIAPPQPEKQTTEKRKLQKGGRKVRTERSQNTDRQFSKRQHPRTVEPASRRINTRRAEPPKTEDTKRLTTRSLTKSGE